MLLLLDGTKGTDFPNIDDIFPDLVEQSEIGIQEIEQLVDRKHLFWTAEQALIQVSCM